MHLLTIFVLMCSLGNISSLPLPMNEYAYMIARSAIKQHDRSVQAQNKLNAKEKIAHLYVEYLQAEEYRNTRNYFYPSRPIETVLDNITASSFYKFLLQLPKGGNLHLHESQILNRRLLLESIRNSSEYDLLYICDHVHCNEKRYYLQYHQNAPSYLWIKVKDSNWTIDEILKTNDINRDFESSSLTYLCN